MQWVYVCVCFECGKTSQGKHIHIPSETQFKKVS